MMHGIRDSATRQLGVFGMPCSRLRVSQSVVGRWGNRRYLAGIGRL